MTGRRLSQVQQLGLEILMILDDVAREQDQTERLRQALLTANPALAPGLYPDYFEAEEEIVEGEVDLNREDTAYDYRQVEWMTPGDVGDQEMDLLQRMLGDSGITVGSPAAPQEGVEDAPGPREPDEPDWT